MTLEQIIDNWKKDSPIRGDELGEEAGNVAILHQRYLEWFTKERLTLRKLESDMKKLKLEKWEHYIQGPSKETKEKGWKIPARGAVIKSDAGLYIDADDDINTLQLKIDYQKEKVDALESIIKMINNRGYAIKNMIDYLQWSGAQ